MTTQPEDIKHAVRRLSAGATVGMINSELKQEGVGSGPRAEVLEIAKKIINRRARIKHLMIAAAGLLTLASGGYWFYLCAINQNPGARVPTVVMVAGLLLVKTAGKLASFVRHWKRRRITKK